ncbi:MAG TPA: hypothetical protein PKD72_15235, partial [Gemmatales bacterium]|nr:hypothetical protein [Gemmatales bacterium]
QQALRLRPGWAAASMGLARGEEQEGNLQQATAYAHQALQQVTGRDILEAGTCHEVGLFFARLKQFDASLAAMHKAVQIDPSNRTYAMNYGFTLARSGRMEDSYQYFCKIMNPAEAAYQVALMARHVGDTQRARQYASLVLQQNPSHKEATELLTKLEQATSTDVQQVQQLESATAPAQ